MKNSMDRRKFLKGVLATSALSLVSPRLGFGATSKVRLACIGIGNRGAEVIAALYKTGLAEVVALCDTEMGAKHTLKTLQNFPGVPQFKDFRQMFDKMGNQIEAVSICTPDHSHFPITMQAMALGKHVYVEKPMAHSFRQIQLMMEAEKKYKVACQMGNQGHSDANYFQFKTLVEAGVIKNVTKITAFMNNPRRWHGITVEGFLPAETLPEGLDWDCWMATARPLAFNKRYLNGEWRSWFSLGNGALGDWGAHILDTAHEFLQLGLPTEVEPKLEGYSPYIFPQASTLAFRFPARNSQPPVEVTWYDGQNNLPPLPENFGEAVTDPNIPPPSTGKVVTNRKPPGKVIYSEDLIFKGGSHGATLQVVGAAKDLKLTEFPRDASNHFTNFLQACQGKESCRSNFAVAGPLCQALAIGILAQQVNTKLVFDPATQRITNHKLADQLLDGPPPRPGWEQYYKL